MKKEMQRFVKMVKKEKEPDELASIFTINVTKEKEAFKIGPKNIMIKMVIK